MKRSITLLLTLVMLLTTVVTANAATPVLTDVVGEKCEAAVNVLAGLGIVEGRSEGKYEPNGSLTRAEMATIILRAMNMEGAQGQAAFEDVPASHWAYANVGAAYQLGIINGMSKTIFSPDTPVTDEQAIKMVVCALGYGVQAEAAGGYPSGYLSKASQLNILKNLKVEGEMNRGDMAILLYNALNTKLSIQSSFGDAKLEFEEDEDVTLLTYYLKAQHYTDVVTATPMGRVTASAPSLKNDELVCGTTVMMAGETNAQDFLGQRVEIYAREDEMTGKPVVLAIVPRATTEVLDVNAQDIEAGDVSLSTGVFAYENENGKVVEEDITGAAVVKNGRLLASPTNADVTPAIGTVRLIRNTGNAYQYIIVEEYTNKIVKSVNERTNRITFMDGTGKTVDFEDKTKAIVMTDAEGEALELGDLAEWDVLSIAESGDGNVIRIRVSAETVEGTITERGTKDVVIGEEKYPIASVLLKGSANVGDEGIFFLDITGTIVAADAASTSDRTYGWLQNAELGEGIDSTVSAKLFTEDDEWKVFQLAENVKFNGTTTKSTQLLDADYAVFNLWGKNKRPSLVDMDGNIVPQLIAYKTTNDGVINQIETAINLTYKENSDEIKTNPSDFSMDWYVNNENNGTKRSGYISTFDGTPKGREAGSYTEYVGGAVFGRVFLSNAKLFVIPDNLADEKGYSVAKATSVLTSTEDFRSRPCLSFYDVNEEYQAGVLVWRQDLVTAAGGAATDSTPKNQDVSFSALVTGVATILDDEGLTKTVLKVMTAAGEKELGITETSKLFYQRANADALTDPDWYGLNPDKSKIEGADRDAIFNASSSTRPKMYIDPADLDPGDVIRYKTTASGDLTVGLVDFRINHSTYTVGENVYRLALTSSEYNESVGSLSKEYLYTANYTMVHGVVTTVGANNFMLTTTLGKNQTGFLPADPAASEATYAISGGTYLEWNTRTQEVSGISRGDLEVDDVVVHFVSHDFKEKMTIRITDGRN